nr:RagB/SusD family nutrient uptake outer membrane protein [Bacteroides propionicifaciens]
MKKIKIYIASFLIGISSFYSCVDDVNFGDSFLEKEPGVDVTIDVIFSDAESARRFLWDNYSRMYYALPTYWNALDDKMNMGMFEALSDAFHSHLEWDGVNRLYYSGAYNAGHENSGGHGRFSFTRENTWEAVRASWVFIENVDRVPNMDDEEKARLKAEAKVIVASRYFDMFRHFGGLPIVDHAFPITTNPADYYTERATVEATTNFMIKLLDEAAKDLPWSLPEDEIANWDGRFTEASALGLKTSILLFAASPLFNDDVPYSTESPQDAVTNHHVWTGGYKSEMWTEALKACEDFFKKVQSNGIYELNQASGTSVNNYREAYQNAYFKRGSGGDNPELLISTRKRYTYGSNGQWDYYFPQSTTQGAFTPTQEFVEMFPMSDGTPFSWDNPEHVKNMFSERDPRLFENILVNNADFQGRQAELWVGGREARDNSAKEVSEYATGYGLYKFILDKSKNINKPTLWPYLRMAEVHLNYAEALMVAGRTQEAIAQVDLVRARVGMKGLKESNPNLNMNDSKVLLEEILRERACELGFEDVRFFDLIRHKRAQDFKKVLHGLRIYRADGINDSWSDKPAADRGPRPTEFKYEVFELSNSKRIWWTNFSTKWYLTAFAPNEIHKDYGLTQNPGW